MEQTEHPPSSGQQPARPHHGSRSPDETAARMRAAGWAEHEIEEEMAEMADARARREEGTRRAQQELAGNPLRLGAEPVSDTVTEGGLRAVTVIYKGQVPFDFTMPPKAPFDYRAFDYGAITLEAHRQQHGRHYSRIALTLDGSGAVTGGALMGKGGAIERIRRITGYLVGTTERWNDAKRAEEAGRVKHPAAPEKAPPGRTACPPPPHGMQSGPGRQAPIRAPCGPRSTRRPGPGARRGRRHLP